VSPSCESISDKQQVCVQPRPSAVNKTLPAFAAECSAAALLLLRVPAAGMQRWQPLVDISCPQGAQQQTRQWPLLLWIEGTDRQTDARRYIDPALHVGSVNKYQH